MSDKAKLANSTAFGVLLTFKNLPPCPVKLLGVSERPIKVLPPVVPLKMYADPLLLSVSSFPTAPTAKVLSPNLAQSMIVPPAVPATVSLNSSINSTSTCFFLLSLLFCFDISLL